MVLEEKYLTIISRKRGNWKNIKLTVLEGEIINNNFSLNIIQDIVRVRQIK